MITKKNQSNKKNVLKIPIWDLLHKQWSKDTVELSTMSFDNEFNLKSWNLVLTSISDKELVISVGKLHSYKLAMCDYCWKEFQHDFQTSPEIVHAQIIHKKDTIDDDKTIYEIESDMSLDLYPIVSDILLLHEDVQYLCDSCKQSTWNNDHSYDSTIGSAISFVKMK